jgi:glycosyltransferase involved in cell wall biosynthesis
MGPFEDRSEAEELAEAFAMVRRRCVAQLALFGIGRYRSTIVRRAFAHGVGSHVHLLRNYPAGRRSDIVASADVVVPSTASGSTNLLDVLSACRPVVAPIDPTTMRLVVPTSAGLVYRPGDVSGMASALLRLLTTPALRHGMACRAGEVAHGHPLLMRLLESTDGSNDA